MSVFFTVLVCNLFIYWFYKFLSLKFPKLYRQEQNQVLSWKNWLYFRLLPPFAISFLCLFYAQLHLSWFVSFLAGIANVLPSLLLQTNRRGLKRSLLEVAVLILLGGLSGFLDRYRLIDKLNPSLRAISENCVASLIYGPAMLVAHDFYQKKLKER